MDEKHADAAPDDLKDRRAFVKTAAYVAPAILTLKAVPSFASHGSASPSHSGGRGKGRSFDPPGHTKKENKGKKNDNGGKHGKKSGK